MKRDDTAVTLDLDHMHIPSADLIFFSERIGEIVATLRRAAMAGDPISIEQIVHNTLKSHGSSHDDHLMSVSLLLATAITRLASMNQREMAIQDPLH